MPPAREPCPICQIEKKHTVRFAGHSESVMVVERPGAGVEIHAHDGTVLARDIANRNDALLWQAAPRLLAEVEKLRARLGE